MPKHKGEARSNNALKIGKIELDSEEVKAEPIVEDQNDKVDKNVEETEVEEVDQGAMLL
jgi:hypothetical protein